ncbi:dihydropteroate synthase-like protein [Methanocella sp. CWC-04]|uniref:Dihydropteroate synthase-like protein n=1 Tax=Methanooceanicella nereidis TaxID=2052831 RepID=A0AAP2RBA5_9EURY|nr:dihydropteroate synthase-like protein [Methanocella sp. CWC-04]MCD1294391.1 dihydropteroate synthase-like protein [Methanocella sp. CWC-04]
MRVLLVTGRLAYPVVKSVAGKAADVIMLDIGVAAFVTPKLLEEAIKDKAEDYDLVLVTGLSSSDFSGLENKLGVKIRLGPKHAFDIPLALQYADKIEFSHKVSACQLLANIKRENAIKDYERLEEEAAPEFMLKGVKIGWTSTMKVMAEVVDATKLSDVDLIKKIDSYASADIIDLGVPLDSTPEAVMHAVKVARSATFKPISIDTLIPEYIEAGIEAGANMVLSLNGSNIDMIGNLIAEKDIPAVVIPDDETLESLCVNIQKCKDIGIEHIVADPVLSPVGHGAVESLERYIDFRKEHAGMPLFFGVGNITELIDADSIGVNALLAGFAMELDASILFTTEHSQKAINSADELKKACMMMALAKERKGPVKDLGIDLLVIKEKRPRKDLIEPGRVIEAKRHEWMTDPKGSFNIFIDNGTIYAKNGDITIAGKDAGPIMHTIIDRGLVSRLDHMGYLGAELMKAELAIRFNRTYLQDDRF